MTAGNNRARLGRFIILNDSASFKNIFQFFLKVLELFESPRGDPYMTATNLICVLHDY